METDRLDFLITDIRSLSTSFDQLEASLDRKVYSIDDKQRKTLDVDDQVVSLPQTKINDLDTKVYSIVDNQIKKWMSTIKLRH